MQVVMVVTFIMIFAMIGLVIWYITAGYSYKHTIDELPQEVQFQSEQKNSQDESDSTCK